MSCTRVELLVAKLRLRDPDPAFDFAREISDFSVTELQELSQVLGEAFPVVGFRLSSPD